MTRFFFLVINECFFIFDPLVRFWYVEKSTNTYGFLIESAIWGYLRPYVGCAKDVKKFLFLPKHDENPKKHTFLVGYDHPHRICAPTEKNVLGHFRPHKQKNHQILCFVFFMDFMWAPARSVKNMSGCQKIRKMSFFF